MSYCEICSRWMRVTHREITKADPAPPVTIPVALSRGSPNSPRDGTVVLLRHYDLWLCVGCDQGDEIAGDLCPGIPDCYCTQGYNPFRDL